MAIVVDAQQVAPQFLEKLSGLVLFQQHQAIGLEGVVVEDGKDVEEVLVPLGVFVDPGQQYPWKLFEPEEGRWLQQVEGQFGVE